MDSGRFPSRAAAGRALFAMAIGLVSAAAGPRSVDRDHGTIAVGKAADLLVLNGDPTLDIRNTTRIAFVVRQGRVLQRQ